MDIIKYKNRSQTTVDVIISDFKQIEFDKIEKYWSILCDPSVSPTRNNISKDTIETIQGFFHQSNKSKKRHGNTLIKIRCLFSKIKLAYQDPGFEVRCNNSFERLICYTITKTLGFNTEVLTREEITKVSADCAYQWGNIRKAIENGCCNICAEKGYTIRDTKWEWEQMYYIVLAHVKYGLRLTIDKQNRQDSMFLLLSRSKPFSDLGRDVLRHIVSFI